MITYRLYTAAEIKDKDSELYPTLLSAVQEKHGISYDIVDIDTCLLYTSKQSNRTSVRNGKSCLIQKKEQWAKQDYTNRNLNKYLERSN